MKLISLLTLMTLVFSDITLAQTPDLKSACDSTIPERLVELRQNCKGMFPSAPRLAACTDIVSKSLESRSRGNDFVKCLGYKTKDQIKVDQTDVMVEPSPVIETESEFSNRIRACGRLHYLMDYKFDCFESKVAVSQLNLCVGAENAEISQRCHENHYGERSVYIPGCAKLKLNDVGLFDACVQTAQGTPEKINLCSGVPRVPNQQLIQFRCIQSLLPEKQVALCIYGDNQRGENYLTRLESIACFPFIEENQK